MHTLRPTDRDRQTKIEKETKQEGNTKSKKYRNRDSEETYGEIWIEEQR
jgi:hypothetical protein